jgi:diphosphomevalonate decarboxylase
MLILPKHLYSPVCSSACRSVKGQVVVWGNQANIKGSSDLYGVEFPNTIHKKFHQDTILLVDKGKNKFQVL